MSPENKAMLESMGVPQPETVGEFRMSRASMEAMLNAVRAEERTRAVDVVRPLRTLAEVVVVTGGKLDLNQPAVQLVQVYLDRTAVYLADNQSKEG